MTAPQSDQVQAGQIQRFARVLDRIRHHQVTCNRCGRPVETEGERTYFFAAQGEGVPDVWCVRCTEELKNQSRDD